MTDLTIPEIRERMLEMADSLHEPHATELRYLAHQTRRRPAFKRAKVTSRKVTDDVEDKIRRLVHEFPGASNQAIANIVGVNPGRITDVIVGVRGRS